MSSAVWGRHCAAVGTGFETRALSFVNIIATPKGRHPVAGFEQALLKVFRRQPDSNARSVSRQDEKDDIAGGFTAVVTVRLAEPQQWRVRPREVLGTAAVRAIVAKVVESELTSLLTSTKRGEKAQSALLLEKVTAEMKAHQCAPPPARPSAEECARVLLYQPNSRTLILRQ